MRYVTLHFRDRRGKASLRYRNRAEITILMCEHKPHMVWFSYRRKAIRYSVNMALGILYAKKDKGLHYKKVTKQYIMWPAKQALLGALWWVSR